MGKGSRTRDPRARRELPAVVLAVVPVLVVGGMTLALRREGHAGASGAGTATVVRALLAAPRAGGPAAPAPGGGAPAARAAGPTRLAEGAAPRAARGTAGPAALAWIRGADAGSTLAGLGVGVLALGAATAAGLALVAALRARRRPIAPTRTADPELPGGPEHAMSSRALMHDLATSLTLAGAEARRLVDGELGPLEPPQAEVMRGLTARIEGMIRLLQAELGRSRAGPATQGDAAGAAPTGAPRGPTSLVALADSAVRAAQPLAGSRGIILDLDRPAPHEGDLVGVWDADGLDRVVANLLDNAIKYTPAGGTVRVAVRRDGRAAVLSVHDTGAGVRPEEVDAVFEPGRRGSTSARLGAPGLGLGLATCRAVVAAHGGRIWLESEGIDRGTAVHVRLPLDRRRGPRGHGRWTARVDWGSGCEVEATVETISRSGAAVRLAVAPPVGALVALRIAGLPPADAPPRPDEDEVAALGRVVRIVEDGHPPGGRPAGAPDPRAPLAAIAFAEVGPGTGARLDRAVAAAGEGGA